VFDRVTDADSWQAAIEFQRRARRNYGAILLREEKRRRPHIYAK